MTQPPVIAVVIMTIPAQPPPILVTAAVRAQPAVVNVVLGIQ
jgi:hypothetical protein